ncbi:MAG: threonine/serine exporter family protein, partial [Bacteroidales bacterium]|nr:threonine/serine exporter family protein [Bacteroidales bacterium]
LNIIIAAFIAAILIGISARIISHRKEIQFEAIAFVSLLPMIPGMYAYRTMQNFIRCIEGAGNMDHDHYFALMSYNALMTFAIILMMAIGVMMVPKKIGYHQNK